MSFSIGTFVAEVAQGRALRCQFGAGTIRMVAHEMAAEVMRAGLAGLAIWWSNLPEVPREQIVAAAVNVLWIGLERMRRGEAWAA